MLTSCDCISHQNVTDTTLPQKARGILALQYCAVPVPHWAVIRHKDDCAHALSIFRNMYPLGSIMARPCPLVPCHGFIESREVRTTKQITNLFMRVKKADPAGCLMLMPLFKCTHSAVISPTAAYIGTGNDGATAGRNPVVVPLTFNIFATMASLPELAGISDPSGALVEVVYYKKGGELYHSIVQLRQGAPSPAFGTIYATEVTKVKRVIRINPLKPPNFMAFRTRIAKAAAGTVIWHPSGSFTSHYAMQAIIAGLPVSIDPEAPGIGSTIRPTTTDPAPLDLDSWKAGVDRSMSIDMYELHGNPGVPYASRLGTIATSSLIATHHSAQWGGPTLSYVLGFCQGTILRIAVAACYGELRYILKDGRTSKAGRAACYEEAFANVPRMLNALCSMSRRFLYIAHESNAVGGISWYKCVEATVNLHHAMQDVYNGKKSIRDSIGDLNNIVNVAHNSGPFLSKFIHPLSFNEIPNESIEGISRDLRGIISILHMRDDPSYIQAEMDNSGWLAANSQIHRPRSAMQISPGAYINGGRMRVKLSYVNTLTGSVRSRICLLSRNVAEDTRHTFVRRMPHNNVPSRYLHSNRSALPRAIKRAVCALKGNA